ncbi:MAG: SWIM zinc finger family protein [Sphingomonadales bacterium]|nr:SWIM zinc finger family protein [Sphingomonadales bacterium]
MSGRLVSIGGGVWSADIPGSTCSCAGKNFCRHLSAFSSFGA